jgi:hypothetical protein
VSYSYSSLNLSDETKLFWWDFEKLNGKLREKILHYNAVFPFVKFSTAAYGVFVFVGTISNVTMVCQRALSYVQERFDQSRGLNALQEPIALLHYQPPVCLTGFYDYVIRIVLSAIDLLFFLRF